MTDRTLIVSATNLLARGFLVVPTDRRSKRGEPVGGLFAVARAIQRVLTFKLPARAVAVIDAHAGRAWPALLTAQLAPLPDLLTALGMHVVVAPDEVHVVASYAAAALAAGDDAIVVGMDKRYAQLVTDHLWWYDANKDVRYTEEIVRKRFTVPPAKVAGWLGVVGDDDALPGVTGIGAKGATTLIETYGSIEAALAQADTMTGRLGNVLRAARADIPRELARATLDPTRPLPRPLAEVAYTAPDPTVLNAQLDQLGFAELLVAPGADGAPIHVELCDTAAAVTAALAALAAQGAPIAIHALLEDPAPVRSELAGIALAVGTGTAAYVAVDSGAWPTLATWLGDPAAPKLGHDLVATIVALRRRGITLAGIVGDSACASHLTQPSNWAPHDVEVVAKHVLGRALAEADVVRGVGQKRRAWRALPVERAAEFAAHRADASALLWRQLAPGAPPALLAEYLALSDTLVRMELTGIRVDPAELDAAEVAFVAIEEELSAQIFALAGHAFNINSGPQLGKVLFEELALPIVSHTKTGWSTSIEALERIEHAHPIVALVLRWRGLRRLRDSWVSALRRCIDDDGRVHSRFHVARSFSGHLINTNPDLGRVPGRTPEMARIRRSFVADRTPPPGRLLMSIDFSQLGLFVLAHLTGDPALVEPLRARDDLHRLTAAAVLERSPAEITLDERQVGKVVNFATFAGQGASSLAMALGIPAAEAKELIARFDRRYARVRAFQDEQLRLARERGYVVTIAGRRWPIGGLESLDPQVRSYAERLARRATHEGSVADVSRRALLEADRALRREGLGAVPVLQILDEVLFDVPEAELATAARVASHAMRHAFELEVPLVVGVEAGRNWADLEPIVVT
ncbi:MAG: DNA polymerase [Proteobacteria bacterium]|nr:DNA polymerase [Pseudomonadota bacterium]